MGRSHLSDCSAAGTRWRILTALSMGVVAATLLASCGVGSASPDPRFPTGPDIAYIVNEVGIVPFNLTTHAVGRPMTNQSFWNPNSELFVAAGGKTAYVNIGYSLAPVNLATGKFGTPILNRGKWDAFAVTPNGRTIWMTGAEDFNSIVPLDTRTGAIGRPMPVPNLPADINLSPNGLTAYVQTSEGADLTVVNLLTDAVGPVFQIPDGVGDLAISPRGRIGWATGAGGDGMGNCQNSCLTPIDLVDGVTGTPIALDHDPYGIALAPDGRTAYVTGGEAGPPAPPDVTEIDLSSGKVTGTFSIPGGANGIFNSTSS